MNTTTYTVTATNSGGSAAATSNLTATAGVIVGLQGTIAAGMFHTCALVNGGVQCWGIDGDGELGNGSTLSSLVPVSVALSP